MLPPIEQIRNDDGSGGYHSPLDAAARFNSSLSTPGWTVAVRVAGSMAIARMRSVERTIVPSVPLLPPDSPVPAPRVTTGTRCAVAQRMAVCTCSVLSARMTAIGFPTSVGSPPERSQRYLSTRATSLMTTSFGSIPAKTSRSDARTFTLGDPGSACLEVMRSGSCQQYLRLWGSRHPMCQSTRELKALSVSCRKLSSDSVHRQPRSKCSVGPREGTGVRRAWSSG